MARTTHECKGCRAVLERKDDLERVQGTTGSAWRCRYCKTTVPAVVAEKIKHQR